jgi:small-conductance mechanosensitive channel
MVPSKIRRKLVFFAGLIAIIGVFLIILSPVEEALQFYLYSHFNIEINSEGHLVTKGGINPPSPTVLTILSLIVHLFHIIKIIFWMGIVIAVVRFFIFLIFGAALKKSSEHEIASILKTVVSIVIYIVAFFIIFQSQYPKVDLTALFTGSTILGIVVGLALQDTLGNLFAGIALQADQPFQVGDVVSISNHGTGIVESVSWRGVKIRNFQNRIIIISNSVLGKATIEVAPKDNLNARLVFFNTVYSAPPTKTIQIVRDVVQKVENVSSQIRPIVRIRNLAESGIDYEIKYWLEDYSKYNETDALIRQRIWYAFQREGIHFAYPTRTLYIENQSPQPDTTKTVSIAFERLSEVPVFEPLTDEDTRKLAEKAVVKVFPPGEPIVKRGQKGDSMFVIHRGSAKVQVREKGKVKVIRNLSEGEFFGEMALFTGEPRSATVIALEETEVLEIKKESLKPILEANPDLVERFGEIITRRQAKLQEITTDQPSSAQPQKKNIFNSIRKFFGVGD